MSLKEILLNAWGETRYFNNLEDVQPISNTYCLKCRQPIDENSEVCPVCDYNFDKNYYEHEDRSFFNIPEFLDIPEAELEFVNIESDKTEEMTVEETARDYFEKQGYSTIFSGNDYWWAIYGLLFWDIIFMKTDTCTPVEMDDDNFETYYSLLTSHTTVDMPNDFFTPIFYLIREKEITKRMKELMEEKDIASELKNSFYKNYNKRCRAIERWGRFTADELASATQLFNKEQILLIVDRLIHDFTVYRYGFPDMIVYNDKEVFFVEAKDRENRLTKNHVLWANFLVNTLKIPLKIFNINKTYEQIDEIKRQFDRIPHKRFIFKLSYDLHTYSIDDMDRLTGFELEKKQRDNEELAIELGRVGKICKVVELFEANVRTECRLYRTYMGLAIIYSRQHRLEDAIRICELGKKYCESSKSRNFDLKIQTLKRNKRYREDQSKYNFS